MNIIDNKFNEPDSAEEIIRLQNDQPQAINSHIVT